MGEHTEISWTDHTMNPWTGCERVSPGCQNCYAEAWSKRSGLVVWGKNGTRRVTSDAYWRQPLKWDRDAEKAGRPALVFCASLADVFEDRDDLLAPRARLWELIEATPHLVWQLLTKRPQNVPRMVPLKWFGGYDDSWPSNVWVGTTVEDQQRADERIPHLLRVPAPVRFLSCEPLLGPVDLLPSGGLHDGGVDWMIIGGESGPGHRPLVLDHARALVQQGTAFDIPVWFKQVGGARPTSGGHLLDGREYHEMPRSYTYDLPIDDPPDRTEQP